MLREYMERAERGESLWLPMLRDRFAREPGAGRMIFRLTGGNAGAREYLIPLPFVSDAADPGLTDKERGFLVRYLAATLYNLLSAFSAQEVVLYYEEGGEQESLTRALLREFEEDPGLGKARRIACRLYGGLWIRALPLSEHKAGLGADPADARPPEAGKLAALLNRRIQSAKERNCLGLDVGGSDIKLAMSRHGKLLYTKEIDWNPAACTTADEIIGPILALTLEANDRMRGFGETLDAVGISFPDVVIGDRIVGGETPKTMGMRNNPRIDYETEFAKLGALREEILARLPRGASVKIANDGNMAAFTAAMELSAQTCPDTRENRIDACDSPARGNAGSGRETEALRYGILAHTLGTDLGTGWLRADGTIPAIPLEMYDLLLDLGDFPSLSLPPRDLRSTRNENSGMAGVRRYLGQAAAYRLAWKLDPALLSGFVREENGAPVILTTPVDLRKPCLEHLMKSAAEDNSAGEVFRRIGENLAAVVREMDWIFGATPPARFLFGRFAKSPRCFALMREGYERMERRFCAAAGGEGRMVEWFAADESLANTPLMRQLAESEKVTVAQFGQAIGAIYYALG